MGAQGQAKAFLKTETGTEITCLFNPNELTVTKANSWKSVRGKGRNTPTLRFQEGSAGTMKVSLTLDTSDTGTAVTEHTNALMELMQGKVKLGSDGNRKRPEFVRFHWGDMRSFKAIVENLQLRFTYFSSDGTPLRAKADLTMKQFADEDAWGPQNPTSGTLNPHEVHTLAPGETLDRVAARHFGDPNKWREIAEANGLRDPLDLTPGTVLMIPERKGVRRG